MLISSDDATLKGSALGTMSVILKIGSPLAALAVETPVPRGEIAAGKLTHKRTISKQETKVIDFRSNLLALLIINEPILSTV
jgi:hypothetical protein